MPQSRFGILDREIQIWRPSKRGEVMVEGHSWRLAFPSLVGKSKKYQQNQDDKAAERGDGGSPSGRILLHLKIIRRRLSSLVRCEVRRTAGLNQILPAIDLSAADRPEMAALLEILEHRVFFTALK